MGVVGGGYSGVGLVNSHDRSLRGEGLLGGSPGLVARGVAASGREQGLLRGEVGRVGHGVVE